MSLPFGYDKKVYTVGLIGYGYWGPILLRNLVLHPRMDVAWVCDRNVSKLIQAKHLAPGVNGITALNDAALSAIDALFICTQAATHYELAKYALQQGVNVFMEKPPTVTVDQAILLNDMATSQGLKVMVDHTYLYNPAYIMVKHLLCQGTLGRIRQFYSVRADFGLFQRDVNIIQHLLYHDIYMVLDLFNNEKIEVVKAGGKGFILPECEDVVSVYLETTSGVIITIINSMIFPVKKREVSLSGDENILFWDDIAPNKIRLYDKKAEFDSKNNKFIYTGKKDSLDIEVPGGEAVASCLDSFASYLDGYVAPPSTLQQAIRVLNVLDKIQQSLRSQRVNDV